MLNVQTGDVTLLGEFGAVGDHIAIGRWLGTGGVQIGVISTDRATNEIVWRVRESGKDATQRFGSLGDFAVAAADFDATGIDDPTVVSKQGRRLVWTIAFDLFRRGRRRMVFSVGSRRDYPFFVDVDGSGAWLGALEVGKKATMVRLRNPRTGERRALRRLPALPGRSNPSLAAMRNPSGQQLLAVSRNDGMRTYLSLIDLARRTLETRELPGVGDVVVSDLLPDAGDEVALIASAKISVGNLFNGAQKVLAKPEGDPILIDAFNVNSIDGDATSIPKPVPTASPVPAALPTRPTGPAPASLDAVCATRSAIAPGEMLIKSEPSNHIHGGDPRTTGYTVVCARLCPRNQGYAQFFFSDGSFAGAVARYGTFRGNGKPRLYGAVGQAPQHMSAEIAARAGQIGNGKLYLQMSAATQGTSTECKEFNPTGRNGSL
jgi:hypothetical protein